MMAIDPTLVRGNDGWADHAEALFDKIKDQGGTRLPGARRHENRANSGDGILVSNIVLEKISAL